MNTLRPRGGMLLVSLWLVLLAGLRAETIIDDAGRFAVDIAAPQYRSEQETSSTAGKTIIHLLTHDGDGTGFIVGYNDYPPGSVAKLGAAATLKKVKQGVLDSMESTATSEGDHQLGDTKGIEYAFAAKDKEGKFSGRVRSYFVGDRLYQIMYLGPPGTANGEEAMHFLNSFRLLR